MATYYFSGTCKWAKLKDPVEQYDKTKKAWTIDLYMDEPSKKLFKDSGLQLKIRTDKEGNEFTTFRRPTAKVIKDSIVSYNPPDVLDKNNNMIDTLVGNDSTVTVKVEVYPTLKGKGHTLVGVRVEDLKVYEQNKSFVVDDVVPF